MMSQKTTYDIISQSISEICAYESSVQISKSAKAYNELEDHLQYDKPENNPQWAREQPAMVGSRTRDHQ